MKIDLVVIAPPTFSKSKRMKDFLDIQREHVEMQNDDVQAATTAGGVINFSTNFTRFKIEVGKINVASTKDITKDTNPFDFVGKLK